MATELTTPIDYTKTVTTQKIDRVVINVKERTVQIYVGSYLNETDPDPYRVQNIIVPFDDIPEGTVKEDFRDVVRNVRTFARNQGILGEGIDTDEL
jgi:hypothetical protein